MTVARMLAILAIMVCLTGVVPASAQQVPTVVINEVESNGGVPGDWVELYNPGASAVNISGFVFRDNDDTHNYAIPAGTTIAAGGYYMLEEAAFGFGLGASDAARLYLPNGTTIVDSYVWTSHAATTYGRCPNGIGAFVTTTASTKGTANNCGAVLTTVNINEVESNGGTPGDWVELYNPGASTVDLSGYVFKDNDDTHNYTIPAGTSIAAGGYYVLEEAAFGFGLGASDAARLFRPDASLADSYVWTSHATTTYGRCPNGTGAFATTASSTKGAANDCGTTAITTVHINEIESSGGVPGDWVELINVGASQVDISGWKILDNDDTHTPYVLPVGSVIAAGGYLVVEEAQFGFGLGAPDSVRLFDSSGALYETYSWTTHATTTYGRCPNGIGGFTTTTSVTKGTANDCGSPVKINEIVSTGGVPGDWVELYNPGASAVDISGYVFKDNDDSHIYAIPAGTSLPAGGYYLLEEAAFGFGLGGSDSARLFDAGLTLVDSYTWTVAATTSYGRCPNGTGSFTATTSVTKGTVNACPGDITFLPWPGDQNIQIVDGTSVFGGNLSGLIEEGSGSATPGILWGIRNGPGSLFRLVWNGTIWTPDPNNGWSSGKTLHYPDGTGNTDSEGVTFSTTSADGIYVSTERNNDVSGTSRNSVLRFDPSVSGTTLNATNEWNLTADLPVVGPNLGIEAITYIPDTYLVAQHFFDESKGHTYNPSEYANHGSGLFFVGLEANGMIYGYALDHVGGGFTRLATLTSGLSGVMDLQFDRELGDLWAICDDGCMGRSVVFRVDSVTGRFVIDRRYERPTGMPNYNNEGFAISPLSECVNTLRPVYWADDTEDQGHAIRRGYLACTPIQAATVTMITSDDPDPSLVGQSYTVAFAVGAPGSGVPDGMVTVSDGSGNTCQAALAGGVGSCTLASTSAGSKTITATYAGSASFLASSGTASHEVDAQPTSTAGQNVVVAFSAASQQITLKVTVSAPTLVNTGTVTFMLLGQSIASGPVSSGSASAVFTIPGGTAAGQYPIQETYSGSAAFLGSSDTTRTLTINPSSPAVSIASKTLTRDSSNNVVLSLTIANKGTGSAVDLKLTKVTITATGVVSPTTPLPSLGTIPAGGSATTTLVFPPTTGASGAAATLTVNGSYTGGTFTSTLRIALP